MMTLFTYGTLQDIEIQKILFGKQLPMEKATLNNWRVYSDEDGYYFISEEEGSSVQGHIIHLSQKQLLIADQWEEVPHYSRIMVLTQLDNGITCESWVYFKANKNGTPIKNLDFSNLPREQVILEARKIKNKLLKNNFPLSNV